MHRDLVATLARIAELERRLDNMFRHGPVAEVDPAKQLARLKIGGSDDKPMLGPLVPYAQIAGALKIHSPPSVGQQMTMLSPVGDFRQALILPFTWSDANPSPSSAGDEHVLTFGSWKITMKGDDITVEGKNIKFDTEEFRTTAKGNTVLADGDKGVVFKGSVDTGGDTNDQASAKVFVPG